MEQIPFGTKVWVQGHDVSLWPVGHERITMTKIVMTYDMVVGHNQTLPIPGVFWLEFIASGRCWQCFSPTRIRIPKHFCDHERITTQFTLRGVIAGRKSLWPTMVVGHNQTLPIPGVFWLEFIASGRCWQCFSPSRIRIPKDSEERVSRPISSVKSHFWRSLGDR